MSGNNPDMGMLQGITETWDCLEERLNEIK